MTLHMPTGLEQLFNTSKYELTLGYTNKIKQIHKRGGTALHIKDCHSLSVYLTTILHTQLTEQSAHTTNSSVNN